MSEPTKKPNMKDGANYAPVGQSVKVVAPNEFFFSVAFLDHGHINGQTNGLLQAGATLKYVYDTDEKRLAAFCEKYPQATVATSFEQILNDSDTQLVASAAIPHLRAGIGIQVMHAGKDYFTDKSPFTTLEQLAEVKKWLLKRVASMRFIMPSVYIMKPLLKQVSLLNKVPLAVYFK